MTNILHFHSSPSRHEKDKKCGFGFYSVIFCVMTKARIWNFQLKKPVNTHIHNTHSRLFFSILIYAFFAHQTLYIQPGKSSNVSNCQWRTIYYQFLSHRGRWIGGRGKGCVIEILRYFIISHLVYKIFCD